MRDHPEQRLRERLRRTDDATRASGAWGALVAIATACALLLLVLLMVG